MLSEKILLKSCNPGCHRYCAADCPFLPSEKEFCPRVKEYIRAVFLAAVPERSMTAEELLGDAGLFNLAAEKVSERFGLDRESLRCVIAYVRDTN